MFTQRRGLCLPRITNVRVTEKTFHCFCQAELGTNNFSKCMLLIRFWLFGRAFNVIVVLLTMLTAGIPFNNFCRAFINVHTGGRDQKYLLMNSASRSVKSVLRNRASEWMESSWRGTPHLTRFCCIRELGSKVMLLRSYCLVNPAEVLVSSSFSWVIPNKLIQERKP